MNKKAFDSHLHLSSEKFSDEEACLLLEMASSHGVSSMMNVSTDEASWKRSQLLLQTAQKCGVSWYQAAATTPHDASGSEAESFFTLVEDEAMNRSSLQAIGETGLDYFYEHSPKKLQQELFHKYIDLAYRAKLPLIIHCRDAFKDFFSIIASHKPVSGVLHCFTGTKEDAKKLLDIGWYVSISGIVTYLKSTEEIREVASFLPLDRLLVETDAPYLAPIPVRGKKNCPHFLMHTLACIADLRKMAVEDLMTCTFQNAERLFQRGVYG